MWFYKYTVEHYFDDREITETGLTFGKTYMDAMSRISEAYEEISILSVKMEQIGEFEDILTQDDIEKAFFK